MVDCATVCSGSGPPRFTIITLTTYGVYDGDDDDVYVCAHVCVRIAVHAHIHACSVRFCSGAHEFTRMKKTKNKHTVFAQVYRVRERTFGYDPLIQVLSYLLACLFAPLRMLTSIRIGRVRIRTYSED